MAPATRQRGWKAVIYLPGGGEKTAWAEKQSDAKDKLDKLKKTWLGAATVTDETVAEYMDWWLASRWDFVTKEQKAEKTVIDYQNSLSYVKSRLGHLKLAELTPAHVYDLLVYLSKYGKTHTVRTGRLQRAKREPLSRRTVTKVREHLGKALTTAVMLGKIPVNVSTRYQVEMPPTDAPVEKKALTEKQVHHLLKAAAADPVVHALLLIGFTQGLRPGENFGAQWERLDWMGYRGKDGTTMGTLDIENTLKRIQTHERNGEKVREKLKMGGVKRDIKASERIMLLPTQVLEVLRRWQIRQKEEQLRAGPRWDNVPGLIFTSEVGTPMNPSNMSRRINKITGGSDWATGLSLN